MKNVFYKIYGHEFTSFKQNCLQLQSFTHAAHAAGHLSQTVGVS